MRGTLTCADCDKQMQKMAHSLPQGRATCHDCRRLKPRVTVYIPPSKRGTCATCGAAMFRGKGSAPDGTARCLPCRRAASPPPTPKRKPKPKATCEDCGVKITGKRWCRACADIHQRIRSADDSRVQRWRREQAAPGLNSYQRKALLRRWKRQGKQCTYCSALATTIDHVLPLVRGGTNHEGNLTPCCRPCNSSKAGWTVIEWRTGKRLGQMVSALAWVRTVRTVQKIKPIVGVQLEFKSCVVCHALHVERAAYCTPGCALTAKRAADRDRRRERFDIPPERWFRIVEQAS